MKYFNGKYILYLTPAELLTIYSLIGNVCPATKECSRTNLELYCKLNKHLGMISDFIAYPFSKESWYKELQRLPTKFTHII